MDIDIQTETLWPDQQTGPWLLRASFAATDGALVPVGIEIWAVSPPGPSSRWTAWRPDLVAADRPLVPLTPAGLRIPLGRLADELAASAARYLPAARAQHRNEADLLETVAKTRRRTGRPPLYPPEHYAAVADVYRQVGGRAPTAGVAERFGVSRSTASKWVVRARRLGLLERERNRHG